MRLSTQMVLGHTGLIIGFVALGALGIGVVERMARASESILNEGLRLVSAARATERGLLLHRAALATGSSSGTEDDVRLALAGATLAATSPESREHFSKLPDMEGLNIQDPASTERWIAWAEKLSTLSLDSVHRAAEHSGRLGRSGIGLIAVVAIVGLVVALYFGYWLSKSVSHPLDRLGRGLDQILSGDLARRFPDPGTPGTLAEIAVGINQLADRLQRGETTPRVDILTVCAAVEKLCEKDSRACGVVSSSHRLLASNEEARKLVLERGSSFQWLASDAGKQDPTAVEVSSLEGPSGEKLGELVRIRSGLGGPANRVG